MTLSTAKARDEMLTLIDAALVASAIPMDISYDLGDDANIEDLDIKQPLVRVRVRHLRSYQATLQGDAGQRRYESIGFINAQILAPLGEGQGLTTAENIATVAVSAYRGKQTAGGVWFRNVTQREAPNNSGNAQINMTAEFTYATIE